MPLVYDYPQMQRLQKFLAAAGVASRRHSEELIAAGRVAVNGVAVTRPGVSVDPERDEVRLDGRLVTLPTAHTYVALHKPRGVVSTVSDPQGRPTVTSLVPHSGRLFPIGRLDYESEGLLLLTDDGELAQRVAHPSFGVERQYRVTVRGSLSREEAARVREGLEDQGEWLSAWRLVARGASREGSEWDVVMREGHKREVRRLFAAVGHPVVRLVRTRVGPVRLGDLAPGAWRPLTPEELRALRDAA